MCSHTSSQTETLILFCPPFDHVGSCQCQLLTLMLLQIHWQFNSSKFFLLNAVFLFWPCHILDLCSVCLGCRFRCKRGSCVAGRTTESSCESGGFQCQMCSTLEPPVGTMRYCYSNTVRKVGGKAQIFIYKPFLKSYRNYLHMASNMFNVTTTTLMSPSAFTLCLHKRFLHENVQCVRVSGQNEAFLLVFLEWRA